MPDLRQSRVDCGEVWVGALGGSGADGLVGAPRAGVDLAGLLARGARAVLGFGGDKVGARGGEGLPGEDADCGRHWCGGSAVGNVFGV